MATTLQHHQCVGPRSPKLLIVLEGTAADRPRLQEVHGALLMTEHTQVLSTTAGPAVCTQHLQMSTNVVLTIHQLLIDYESDMSDNDGVGGREQGQ